MTNQNPESELRPIVPDDTPIYQYPVRKWKLFGPRQLKLTDDPHKRSIFGLKFKDGSSYRPIFTGANQGEIGNIRKDGVDFKRIRVAENIDVGNRRRHSPNLAKHIHDINVGRSRIFVIDVPLRKVIP